MVLPTNSEQCQFEYPGTIFAVPAGEHCSGSLRQVSAFTLSPGKVIIITGESGSGKSYFLSLLTGLADQSMLPDDMQQLNAQVKQLPNFIFVPQFETFNTRLSIKQECMFTWWTNYRDMLDEDKIRLLGGKNPANFFSERFIELSHLLHLNDHDKRISELSGGGLKRFGLLLRLPFPSPFIVLDEPDTGVDFDTAKEIVGALVDGSILNREPAIIVVTHSAQMKGWLENEKGGEVIKIHEPGQGSEKILQEPAPTGKSETSTKKKEEPDPPLLSFVLGIVMRSFSMTRHRLRLLFHSLQDITFFLIAPILIFGVLRISNEFHPTNYVPLSGGYDACKYFFSELLQACG